MRLIQANVESVFRRLEDGRTAFYPFGVLTRGYILADEQVARARRGYRWWIGGGLAAGIAFGELVSWTLEPIWFLVLLPLFIAVAYGGYRLWLHRIVAGAERTPERLRFAESYQRFATAAGGWVIVPMVLGWGFVACTMLVGLTADVNPAFFVFSLLFFGLLTGINTFVFGLWLRQRRHGGAAR